MVADVTSSARTTLAAMSGTHPDHTTTTAQVDPAAVGALLSRARREVDEGLLPACQIAVAYRGEVVVDATFGAPEATRFVPFSATKVLTAAAIWRLIAEAGLDVAQPVATYVPAFAANGKEAVTVEHVLLHTSGFPMAPIEPREWRTREARLAAFEGWRLEHAPGERFVYHPISAHFVLCEIVETLTGEPYVDALHRLVTQPLGIPRLLGIPIDQQADIADVVGVGDEATADELAELYGDAAATVAAIPRDFVNALLMALNHPKARAVGVPGGGGIVRAADLALVYQALLHNTHELWDPSVLADATGRVRNTLPDPLGVPANRSLGLMMAGDDGFAARRGFGTRASAKAFGHDGAGGQLAFADPASGLSCCYVTNGLDRNLLREHRRTVDIANAVHALVTTR